MSKIISAIRWRGKLLMERYRRRRHNRAPAPPPAMAAPLPADADQRLVARLARHPLPSLQQLRHVGKLFTRSERRLAAALATLALGCLVFLGVRWAARQIERVPIAKGSLTEGVVGAPQLINPLLLQANDVDNDIATLMFCGLFRFTHHPVPEPQLASRHTVSPDGRTYTVTMRTDATWHDGAPVTADDVVFTFLSAQDPDFRSPLSRSLQGVQVKKTGDHEVTFALAEPAERFLEVLTTGLLPKHLWKDIPPIHAPLTEYNLHNPVGCGPWRFKSLVKERRGNIRSYTLTPFAHFFGRRPYLRELTFKFYPDLAAALKALQNRSVDAVGYLAKGDPAFLADHQINQYMALLPQYTAVFFNPSAHPGLADKNVRLALAAAVNRARIISEGLALNGEAIDGPLLPDFPGFDPNLAAPSYDPARAEALLDAAGWQRMDKSAFAAWQAASSTPDQATATATGTVPLPLDGPPYYRRKPNGPLLELTLATVDRAEYVAMAELVRGFWENVGVKVNVSVVPTSRMVRDVIKPRNYQALLFGESYGHDPDPYPFWHSSQINDPGLNLARVANRQIDRLLEEARTTSDPAARAQKYREFSRMLQAETPAVFLFTPRYTYAVHQKFKGVALKGMVQSQDRFNTLAEWYVATARRWKKSP